MISADWTRAVYANKSLFVVYAVYDFHFNKLNVTQPTTSLSPHVRVSVCQSMNKPHMAHSVWQRARAAFNRRERVKERARLMDNCLHQIYCYGSVALFVANGNDVVWSFNRQRSGDVCIMQYLWPWTHSGLSRSWCWFSCCPLSWWRSGRLWSPEHQQSERQKQNWV